MLRQVSAKKSAKNTDFVAVKAKSVAIVEIEKSK